MIDPTSLMPIDDLLLGLGSNAVSFQHHSDCWEAAVNWLSPRIRRKLQIKGVAARNLDDGLQDVFLTLFQNIGKLREVEAFDVYLHRIIQGVARNHRRRQGHEVDIDVDTLYLVEPAQREGEFSDSLSSDLDGPEFKVVILLYSQGLTRQEAANSLGWSKRKLIKTRNKAVTKMKSRVSRDLLAGAAVLNNGGTRFGRLGHLFILAPSSGLTIELLPTDAQSGRCFFLVVGVTARRNLK